MFTTREGASTTYLRNLEPGRLFVLQVPRSRDFDKGKGLPQQRSLELKPTRRR